MHEPSQKTEQKQLTSTMDGTVTIIVLFVAIAACNTRSAVGINIGSVGLKRLAISPDED